MGAFFYGVSFQWKLDIRSKTLLVTCYIVPLVFFAIMGGIFTSVMPESRNTLIQSMTVFGVTMGALIGLPPSLVEIYGSDIKKIYKANGVPLWLGFALTNLSAFIHLFCMSLLLDIAAPMVFDAAIPANPGWYFACLAVWIVVSLSVASVIGLAVKEQAKTSMVSILVSCRLSCFQELCFRWSCCQKHWRQWERFFRLRGDTGCCRRPVSVWRLCCRFCRFSL